MRYRRGRGATRVLSRRGSVKMRRNLVAFLRDESGATAIEYGLIATGIALAIIPVITGVGSHLKSTFQAISTAVK
jgi:pilus assembly protein Flp/PilA